MILGVHNYHAGYWHLEQIRGLRTSPNPTTRPACRHRGPMARLSKVKSVPCCAECSQTTGFPLESIVRSDYPELRAIHTIITIPGAFILFR